MSNVLAGVKIQKGSRVAVTMKNGSRVAGTCLGDVRTDRSGESYFTVRRFTGYMIRVYLMDAASVVGLGEPVR